MKWALRIVGVICAALAFGVIEGQAEVIRSTKAELVKAQEATAVLEAQNSGLSARLALAPDVRFRDGAAGADYVACQQVLPKNLDCVDLDTSIDRFLKQKEETGEVFFPGPGPVSEL